MVALHTGLNRESLYRALAPDGNPTLHTLDRVLAVFGLRLTVARIEGATPIPRRNWKNLSPPVRRDIAKDSDATERNACEPRRGRQPESR